jgi:CHAT domain-containing protein
MAGDFKGYAEPGLVLTPPMAATAQDDGLLTASEVTQLKLNSDWVILSACNTAAGESRGAEGLSGLAKAFFYAGARSLLVSHWSVHSKSATALTTKTMHHVTEGMDKAKALQQAQLDMLNEAGNSNLSHPAFWAPFVLVGD